MVGMASVEPKVRAMAKKLEECILLKIVLKKAWSVSKVIELVVDLLKVLRL